jgi:hypothetical protein
MNAHDRWCKLLWTSAYLCMGGAFVSAAFRMPWLFLLFLLIIPIPVYIDRVLYSNENLS